MSPILETETRRRYQREWVAKRRAEFFADKTCIDCGTTEHLELDAATPPSRSTTTCGRWSTGRREAKLAKYDIRCCSCRRTRFADHETRHGTRGRYEQGCRYNVWREAKSRRNAQYREQHRGKIGAKRHARPSKPRTARTASGIVGVCYSPDLSRARRWRVQIGMNKLLIQHLGMFATKAEAAAARAAAERELREPSGR